MSAELFEALDKSYIDGITFSGGDPLHPFNRDEVFRLMKKIRKELPNKTIWLYSGYKFEECVLELGEIVHNHNYIRFKRQCIIKNCDVLVDGEYKEELRDVSLHWRGSSNQRVIDVQKSLKKGEIVLWNS